MSYVVGTRNYFNLPQLFTIKTRQAGKHLRNKDFFQSEREQRQRQRQTGTGTEQRQNRGRAEAETEAEAEAATETERERARGAGSGMIIHILELLLQCFLLLLQLIQLYCNAIFEFLGKLYFLANS